MSEKEKENSNILLLSSLNLFDIKELLDYYMNTWNDSIKKYTINKDFYLEINEELEGYKLLVRYKSLSKLFYSLIITDKLSKPLSIFDEEPKNLLNTKEINKAYEYGIFESLVSNLSYLYAQFISYNENSLNLQKCELILFTKINLYLLLIILFELQFEKSIINYIKYNGDLLEETILKFIKQYTHKYVPIRILLGLYTVFFSILFYDEEEKESKNKNNNKKEKYLTKENYLKYLKPENPLIFLSSYHSHNKYYCIERFYRRNLIMQQKSEIEMVFISQILKILLITFTNSKNPEANELTKDFYTDLILKQYYLKKKNPIFIEDDNANNNKNISIVEKEINFKQMKEFISTLSNEEKLIYNIINIFNIEGIIYIISFLYLKALKTFKKKNLIQFTYLSFLFKDSNGLKVFLALLKQENKMSSEQFMHNQGLDNLVILYDKISMQMLLALLKIIYNIVNKIDDFIIVLIDCHVPIMLNNILNSGNNKDKLLNNNNFENEDNIQNGEENNNLFIINSDGKEYKYKENKDSLINSNIGVITPEIKKACLKLFKCQIKFLNKAWRQENENILTDIYLMMNVSCDKTDNYLKYKDYKDKDLIKEIDPLYFKEEELKAIFSEFHEYNYFRYTSNPELYDDYFISKIQSLYTNTLLSLQKKFNENKND